MADFVNIPPPGTPRGGLAIAPKPAGAAVSPAAPGSVLFNTPGTYSWRVPFGVTAVAVEMYGCGGGGAGAATGTSVTEPGGGGGGGYAAFQLGAPLIAYGSSLPIVVGSLGAGGASSTGGHGGSCTMGASGSNLIVEGGQGGDINGGTASGGSVAVVGSFPVIDLAQADGSIGLAGSKVAAGAGGNGAGPLGGAGGAGGNLGVGSPGASPGGGGGGALRHSGASLGGNGGGGQVRISWPPAP